MDSEFVIPALWYLCLVFSFTVHEAAHAISAYRLGDDTPMEQGRVTLNPIAHMDLFGSVIVPIMLLVTTGTTIGWAKPVEILPSNFENPGRDDKIVTLAGPGSNVIVAILCIGVGRTIVELLGFVTGPNAQAIHDAAAYVLLFLNIMLHLNILLAIFNMLPVPPLDGHHLLPDNTKETLRQFGIFPLLLVFVMWRPIYNFFEPVFSFATSLMIGG